MTVRSEGRSGVPPSAHTPAYDPVDLTTCDREPIHVPGAIQPHGFLLALDSGLRVVTVSGNLAEMIDVPPAEAIGKPLAEVLGPSIADLVREGTVSGPEVDLLTARLPGSAATAGRLSGLLVDVRVHRSGDRVVVEVEPAEHLGSPSLSLRSARGAMGRLAGSRSVVDLGDRLAQEVRDLLGFDRVMVYRFDAEWNGEVIAEVRRDDLNSFLGLHYPASDIPAQARRLYTVNWTRLIADIDYTPVPLQPLLDPGTGAPLDLSHSTLRSVSPIHIEYLSNMGVTASMSVSIVVNEQLWGLVACHHYSGPHRPSQDARAAAELLGQLASQMFFDREQAERREAILATRSRLSALIDRLSAHPQDLFTGLLEDPDLLSMFDAQGASLFLAGEVRSTGLAVSEVEARRIADLLQRPDDVVTSSDNLAAQHPALGTVPGGVSGALRVGSSSDWWLLLLRSELEQFVDWGGDPTNKQIAAEEGEDVRLSPRKSFERWREVVHGRSLPWTPPQLDAAETLAGHLQNQLLLRSREQVAMAESVQRSVVLDRAPTLEGVDVAATYLPASTYQLGGDWWDAFELGDGRVALVVGDVAGHGVTAASAMVQIRTTLRAFLFDGHGAGECLDRLDTFMDRMLPNQLASAVIVIVDRTSGTLEIANAGHPPPLQRDQAGARFLELDAKPLLGVGGHPASSTVIDLDPDATLLLFTDGLIERRGLDLDESLERLRRASLRSDVADLVAWMDWLVVDLAVNEDDDTTLLALRLRP
jgi:two-component system, chemotaxis family, sensor kinase Cph1